MKKTILKVLGFIAITGALTGCGSYGRDPFYKAWYDVYGNYCGNGNPQPGCNFYRNGSKITASQDPYYNGSNTYYYDYWTYTDSYGTSRSYLGYAWQSGTGILYDSNGTALNEQDEGYTASADLIALSAKKEKQTNLAVGKILAQKYALAEEKGVMISKTLQDWAVLARDRARTDDDTSDFAARLYGVNPSKAKTAMNEAVSTQSQKPLEDLNVEVAAHWGTSPEVSKEILKGWYKEEVAAYGIK